MDILDKLRAVADMLGEDNPGSIARHAADEIERLRAENAKFTAMHQRTCPHMARTHNTGGWHCPECGKRGPILQPQL